MSPARDTYHVLSYAEQAIIQEWPTDENIVPQLTRALNEIDALRGENSALLRDLADRQQEIAALLEHTVGEGTG